MVTIVRKLPEDALLRHGNLPRLVLRHDFQHPALVRRKIARGKLLHLLRSGLRVVVQQGPQCVDARGIPRCSFKLVHEERGPRRSARHCLPHRFHHASQLAETGEWFREFLRQSAEEAGRIAGVRYAEGFRRLTLGP